MSCPDAAAPARVDGFFGGRFFLHQPVGKGFRAGLDAMLLAACVPEDAKGECADIGAGTGAVGFAAATRAEGLSITLVENEPATASLLRASIGDLRNALLGARLSVAQADIVAGRETREAAGLRDGRFALVLTNPPFFPGTYRRSLDPSRSAALFAPDEGFLPNWLRACAALVSAGGRLVLVARPADLPVIAQTLDRRLGGLSVLPVHTRPGAARRILVGARAGSREALSILPALQLHGDDSARTLKAIADGTQFVDLFPGRF